MLRRRHLLLASERPYRPYILSSTYCSFPASPGPGCVSQLLLVVALVLGQFPCTLHHPRHLVEFPQAQLRWYMKDLMSINGAGHAYFHASVWSCALSPRRFMQAVIAVVECASARLWSMSSSAEICRVYVAPAGPTSS